MAREVKHRLAAVLEAKGLKPAALADRIGTTRQTIHKLLSGAQKMTVDWIYALAEGLEVDPAEILMDGGRSQDETRILGAFRRLGPDHRGLATRIVTALSLSEQEFELLELARRLPVEELARLVSLARALETRGDSSD